MKRLLLACAISALATPLAAQGPWQQLFNGKDFTGWTIGGGQANGFGTAARAAGPGAGGARAGGGGAAQPAAPAAPLSTNPTDRGWAVQNGIITTVPVTGGGRGGTLSTVAKFHDFELELDYKLDEAPNVECTPKLGEKVNARSGQMAQEQNLSKDAACLANSGIYFRMGYQLNLGRREAGEYVGVVMHRVVPGESVRGNVHWISTGDCGPNKIRQYVQECNNPEIRKKNDWNHVRISFKGDHLQVWLNNTQITDVVDPLMAGEESWKEPAPISFQPFGESGGFQGKVQYRNIRIRTL